MCQTFFRQKNVLGADVPHDCVPVARHQLSLRITKSFLGKSEPRTKVWGESPRHGGILFFAYPHPSSHRLPPSQPQHYRQEDTMYSNHTYMPDTTVVHSKYPTVISPIKQHNACLTTKLLQAGSRSLGQTVMPPDTSKIAPPKSSERERYCTAHHKQAFCSTPPLSPYPCMRLHQQR